MHIATKPWKYKLLFPIHSSAELYGSIMRKTAFKCENENTTNADCFKIASANTLNLESLRRLLFLNQLISNN